MAPLKNFAIKFPVIFALASMVLMAFLAQGGPFTCMKEALMPFLGAKAAASASNAILAVILAVWALLFIGPRVFTFSKKGIAYGLKMSIYFFVLMVVGMGALSVGSLLAEGGPSPEINPIVVLVLALVTSASLGIFEEVSFRVCGMGGLIKKMGGTRNGVLWAVFISSILFGFAHNVGTLFGAGTIDATLIIYVLSKTLESAAAGVLFATIYLRTRNLWAAMIVHAIGDLPVLFITNLSVSSGGDSSVTMGAALAIFGMFVLYIPIVVVCVKKLKRFQEVPCVSPLDEGFLPRVPVDVSGSGSDDGNTSAQDLA